MPCDKLKKSRAAFSINQNLNKTKNNCTLLAGVFPRLAPVRYLLRVLIGSFNCLRLLKTPPIGDFSINILCVLKIQYL